MSTFNKLYLAPYGFLLSGVMFGGLTITGILNNSNSKIIANKKPALEMIVREKETPKPQKKKEQKPRFAHFYEEPVRSCPFKRRERVFVSTVHVIYDQTIKRTCLNVRRQKLRSWSKLERTLRSKKNLSNQQYCRELTQLMLRDVENYFNQKKIKEQTNLRHIFQMIKFEEKDFGKNCKRYRCNADDLLDLTEKYGEANINIGLTRIPLNSKKERLDGYQFNNSVITELYGSSYIRGVWTLQHEIGHIMGLNDLKKIRFRRSIMYHSTNYLKKHLFPMEIKGIVNYTKNNPFQVLHHCKKKN